MQRRFRKVWLPNPCVWLAVTCTASTAGAAELTDVADAADKISIAGFSDEDPFDAYVSVEYSGLSSKGKITREPAPDRNGVALANCTDSIDARDCLPVDELKWSELSHRLKFRGEVGMFHDLSLVVGLNYVARDQLNFDYATGVNAGNSSVVADNLFKLDYESWRAGWGTFDLGLRWGALSDERDDTKPNWVIHFTWSAPFLSGTWNPQNRGTQRDPASASDGVHRLTFGTALSKRVANFGAIAFDPNANRRGYVEPYFEVRYVLPLPDETKALRDMSSGTFARKPSHEGYLDAGMEIVALEDLKHGRRVAIDLRLQGAFFSEGRNYSVLTAPLQQLTYTEQYFQVGGRFGLNVQAAKFIRIRVGMDASYTTEHYLTFEEVGDDKNKDGQVLHPDQDTNQVKDDLNPYWDSKTDQIGFRFKGAEQANIGWFADLMFTF